MISLLGHISQNSNQSANADGLVSLNDRIQKRLLPLSPTSEQPSSVDAINDRMNTFIGQKDDDNPPLSQPYTFSQQLQLNKWMQDIIINGGETIEPEDW